MAWPASTLAGRQAGTLVLAAAALAPQQACAHLANGVYVPQPRWGDGGFCASAHGLEEFAQAQYDSPERWVQAHNHYRSCHGSPNLVWHPELVVYAKVWAENLLHHCQDSQDIGQWVSIGKHDEARPHDPNAYNEIPEQGENLYSVQGASAGDPVHQAVEAWYREVDTQCPEHGHAPGCAGTLNHYTAMIWKDATMVGCYSATRKTSFGNFTVSDCRYASAKAPPPGRAGCQTPNTFGCAVAGVYPDGGQVPALKVGHCPVVGSWAAAHMGSPGAAPGPAIPAPVVDRTLHRKDGYYMDTDGNYKEQWASVEEAKSICTRDPQCRGFFFAGSPGPNGDVYVWFNTKDETFGPTPGYTAFTMPATTTPLPIWARMPPGTAPGDCTPVHSIKTCGDCLRSEQCAKDSYCCPFMKKCVDCPSRACQAPIAFCLPPCDEALDPKECKCKSERWPDAWQMPLCSNAIGQPARLYLERRWQSLVGGVASVPWLGLAALALVGGFVGTSAMLRCRQPTRGRGSVREASVPLEEERSRLLETGGEVPSGQKNDGQIMEEEVVE